MAESSEHLLRGPRAPGLRREAPLYALERFDAVE
jgi:hypothetical protein